MSKLKRKNIKVGQFLWYKSEKFNCGTGEPAIIIKVDRKKKTFRVKSLHDGQIDDETYNFSVTRKKSDCFSCNALFRKSMSLISAEQAYTYMKDQVLRNKSYISYLHSQVKKAKISSASFQALMKELFP